MRNGVKLIFLIVFVILGGVAVYSAGQSVFGNLNVYGDVLINDSLNMTNGDITDLNITKMVGGGCIYHNGTAIRLESICSI